MKFSTRYLKLPTKQLILFFGLVATSFLIFVNIMVEQKLSVTSDSHPPMDSAAVSTNISRYVAMQLNTMHLEESVQCYKRGKRGDTMYYYSTKPGACLPFPGIESTSSYVPPSDPTMTTVMATVDNDLTGPSGTFRTDSSQSTSNAADTVIEKHSPSLHSRWFFESWRLWEGENKMCSRSQTSSRTWHQSKAKPSTLRNSPYVTRGSHNSSLPVSLYDLHNFCIDELRGTLIGFEDIDQKMNLSAFAGVTEHVYNKRFLTMDRLLHPSNQEAIPLVSLDRSLDWKSVVAASIETHHRGLDTNSLPPEVLFVEDQAMIILITAMERKNPCHQFHRVGSNIAQARMLKARSLLILTDFIAQNPKDRWHQTQRFLTGNTSDDRDLLPKYFVTFMNNNAVALPSPQAYTSKKSTSKKTKQQRPFYASPVTSNRIVCLKNITTRPIKRESEHPAVVELAKLEAQSTVWKVMPFEAQFSSLLSTGDDGCEAFRCSQNTSCAIASLSEQKRCGRPYALVNIALSLQQFVNNDTLYRADTQNYSTTVWGLAVRETLREAKRLKRDIWLATHSMKPEVTQDSPTEDQFSYIFLWRRLIVDVLSSKRDRILTDMPKPDVMFENYFSEYFAYRLEANHFMEVASTTHPRRQLICYRRAVVGHVFHKKVEKLHHPTSIGLSVNANCNLKDTMRAVYESVWARHGMCMNGAEPQKDTNRDAHPIFTSINKKSGKQLQKSFEFSRSKLENVIKSVVSKSKSELRSTFLSMNMSVAAPHVNLLMSSFCEIQNSYDEQFLRHFTSETHNGRPITVYISFRSGKRLLTHWRLYLSALMNSGIGKFVKFEFYEGLTSGVFSPSDPAYTLRDPLNTARARQFNSYLTADLYIGPHGADMHGIAFLKPSAFATELAYDGFDTTNKESFRGGYFSSYAYARNLGYLKVFVSHKEPPKEKREKWEGSFHAYMSLPELRRTLSLTICSWLAVNSLRTHDEGHRGKRVNGSEYSHLVPWWCRGGPKALVRSTLRHLLISEVDKTANRSTKDFSLRQQQLERLIEPSGDTSNFRFTSLQCAPLQVNVKGKTSKVSIAVPALSQKHLDRLQNECAKPLSDISQVNTFVEGLQSLFESVLFLRETEAYTMARVISEGVMLSDWQLTHSRVVGPFNEKCGYYPLQSSNKSVVDPCLKILLEELIVYDQCYTSLTCTRHQDTNRLEISEKFLRFVARDVPLLGIVVSDPFLKADIIDSIVQKFYVIAMPATPVVNKNMPLLSSEAEFSYGWQCDNNTTR